MPQNWNATLIQTCAAFGKFVPKLIPTKVVCRAQFAVISSTTFFCAVNVGHFIAHTDNNDLCLLTCPCLGDNSFVILIYDHVQNLHMHGENTNTLKILEHVSRKENQLQ